MQTIKLEFIPSFHNELIIELKSDGQRHSLVCVKSSYEHTSDEGKAWHSSQITAEEFSQAFELAENVIQFPPERTYFVICDGMGMNLLIRNEGKEQSRKCDHPEEGTNETELASTLFELCLKYIQDDVCENIIELIGTYIWRGPNFKEYENPYRLKIFASINYDNYKQIIDKIELLKTKEKAILDLSNYESSIRNMDEYFVSLKNRTNLEIRVNKAAGKYLQLIGFSEDELKFIS